MGHLMDRCDVLDVLEEGVVTGRAVTVELDNDKQFVDEVRDVATTDGEDWAVFKAHGTVRVNDIRFCARAEPRDSTYTVRPG
jgi:hypothetical protein